MCARISHSARFGITMEQCAHDCLMACDRCVGFFVAIKLRDSEVEIVSSVSSTHVSQSFILSCRNNCIMKAIVDLDQMLSGRLHNTLGVSAMECGNLLELRCGGSLGRQTCAVTFQSSPSLVDFANLGASMLQDDPTTASAYHKAFSSQPLETLPYRCSAYLELIGETLIRSAVHSAVRGQSR